MSETTFEKIIRKSGMKPRECKCQQCKSQCQQPGFGTPEDMFKIIAAGYGKRVGRVKFQGIEIIVPIKENGNCTFFKDGLCELHDQGLKPTVCKLSHHSTEKINPKKLIARFVLREWQAPKEEIYKLVDKIIKHESNTV